MGQWLPLIVASCVAALLGTEETRDLGFLHARASMLTAALHHDKARYARFLVPDFTWVDRAGRLRDKRTVVDDLPPSDGSADPAPDIRDYGRAVVLVGIRRGGESAYLQVWVRQEQRWLMAAHQGTAASHSTDWSAPAGPSTGVPADYGTDLDLMAIERLRKTLHVAQRDGDATPFRRHATDLFLALGPFGVFDKPEHARAIEELMPPTGGAADRARVLDAAVTLAINAADTSVTTIAYVRQSGEWRQAAIATTPRVTGGWAPR
jgi:hypothetical protein